MFRTNKNEIMLNYTPLNNFVLITYKKTMIKDSRWIFE